MYSYIYIEGTPSTLSICLSLGNTALLVPEVITNLTRRQEERIEERDCEIGEGGYEGIILSFSLNLDFTVPPAVALLNYEKP